MIYSRSCSLFFVFWISILLSTPACTPELQAPAKTPRDISAEIQEALEHTVLESWYPRVLDTLHGGYLSDFDYQWKETGKQDKMIVTQARHIWTSAKASALYPEEKLYLEIAAHGYHFLANTMWDKEMGGFYNRVNRVGDVYQVPDEGRIIKQAYGNAFAMYGLAAYYKISQDMEALNLAIKGFLWLEKHSHDPEQLGYFQFMERNGTALIEGLGNTPPKDQNSTIHLLEAFTELYQVWPDPLVKMRIEELIVLIRDTITNEKGSMRLHFYRYWTPLSHKDSTEEFREQFHHLDHVSFGHDIETAYLLLEASEVIGDGHNEKTLTVTKKMIDHSLRFGWDASVGGLYDAGYYTEDETDVEIIRDTKNWWAQVETLNSLLLAADMYPNDPLNYRKKFEKQWAYIYQNLIDHEHGGFYLGGLDKQPQHKKANKSGIWKGAYHTARSLMNVAERLK